MDGDIAPGSEPAPVLGLFDYEYHYAYCDRGSFYKKHLDAFKGGANRPRYGTTGWFRINISLLGNHIDPAH